MRDSLRKCTSIIAILGLALPQGDRRAGAGGTGDARARSVLRGDLRVPGDRPHSALGYQTPEACAAQLAATGDRLHETEAFRRSPIAPSAQAGNCQPPALVSAG